MTVEHLAHCRRMEVFEDSYGDLVFGQSVLQGTGTLSSVPGRVVEATLYHTGLTNQVNARAARYAVDDLLTVGGGVGLVKGAAKSVVKNARHYGARLGRLKGTVFDAGQGTSRSLSALDLARGNYSQRTSNFEWLQAANRNLQGYRVPQVANSNSFFQDLQAVANSNTGARAAAGNMSNGPRMSVGKGGSNNHAALEYLGPGRVLYDGVEFRAVRDLSYLSEAELRIMEKRGVAPRGGDGKPMHGHHYNQLSHRDPDGFIVEMPRSKHKYANKIQHPKSAGEGLPAEARKEWNESLREKYWKERAKTELLKRGISI
ncbi:HNH/ENDO VII family nuclease [Candidatus Odyssella thessalonicensis]|uniref:HNH/ENDO VII family nuclease n=1 Tax=Candidatus Odyssella thessalonicensis TaxID=84647 RepID=UPI0002D9D09F|nr:HNH/ENDO VII family nuclease [Candidatus Odyssella thessalonicensis]